MAKTTEKQPPIHPGEYIDRYILQEKLITQSELAKKLGVSRQTISQLVNKQRLLSRSMATRLAAIIDKKAEFWLNLSKEYEIWEYSESKPSCDSKPKLNIKKGGILVDHEILDAIKNKYLLIRPLNEDHLQPASIDLSIGKHAIVRKKNGDEEKIDFVDELVIPPDARAKVKTLEYIELSPYIVGRLGATTEIFNDSVTLAYGAQVDPGYKGHLEVYISNWGDKEVTFGTGWPFLTVEFSFLSTAPNCPYKNNYETEAGIKFLINLRDNEEEEVSKAAEELLYKIT